MTIRRRNRLIRVIAEQLAESAGREARAAQEVQCDLDDCKHRGCGWRAYEDAARDTYHHLIDRRVYRGRLPFGLPYLQRQRAAETATIMPPKGWEDRAVSRARAAGLFTAQLAVRP